MNVYTEVLTWILCSHKENFELLNREDDNSAVIIGNPRGADFEVPLQNLYSYTHWPFSCILVTMFHWTGGKNEANAWNTEDSWF